MDQSLATKIAKEGFQLYEQGKLEEAQLKYWDAIKISDPSHWHSQDIYGEYGSLLQALGKNDEAIVTLKQAYNASRRCDEDTSISVTVSRYFLSDLLMREGQFEEAELVLDKWFDRECDGKWMMSFLKAKLSYLIEDEVTYKDYLNEALANAPEGKWNSIEEIKELVEENDS